MIKRYCMCVCIYIFFSIILLFVVKLYEIQTIESSRSGIAYSNLIFDSVRCNPATALDLFNHRARVEFNDRISISLLYLYFRERFTCLVSRSSSKWMNNPRDAEMHARVLRDALTNTRTTCPVDRHRAKSIWSITLLLCVGWRTQRKQDLAFTAKSLITAQRTRTIHDPGSLISYSAWIQTKLRIPQPFPFCNTLCNNAITYEALV